jgi:hypothetical protein
MERWPEVCLVDFFFDGEVGPRRGCVMATQGVRAVARRRAEERSRPGRMWLKSSREQYGADGPEACCGSITRLSRELSRCKKKVDHFQRLLGALDVVEFSWDGQKVFV